MELLIDEKRFDHYTSGNLGDTGIFVRAKMPSTGRWMSADIVVLTKESLRVWLRSRGGDNSWAEDTVAILLGHGHFDKHPHEAPYKVENPNG